MASRSECSDWYGFLASESKHPADADAFRGTLLEALEHRLAQLRERRTASVELSSLEMTGIRDDPSELDELSSSAQHSPDMLGWLRAGLVAGAIGLTSACGNAPTPPSPIPGPEGAGSGSSTDQDILPNRPVSGGTMPDEADVDAGSEGKPDDMPADPPPVEAGPPRETTEYYACMESPLLGCDYIHVTARDFESDLCFQLTLENCEDGERGLAVDTPIGWRLSSGSVVQGTEDCVPGEFYIRSVPATDASGSITWDVEARPPADLVIDVTLDLASQVEERLPRQASLASSGLAGPLAECAD
jgi:hypothetical protein